MSLRLFGGSFALAAASALLALESPAFSQQYFDAEYSYYYQKDDSGLYKQKVEFSTWPGEGIGNIINNSENSVWWSEGHPPDHNGFDSSIWNDKGTGLVQQLALWRATFGLEEEGMPNNAPKPWYGEKFDVNGPIRIYFAQQGQKAYFVTGDEEGWYKIHTCRQNQSGECNSNNAVIGRDAGSGIPIGPDEGKEPIFVIGLDGKVREDTQIKNEASSSGGGDTFPVFAGGILEITEDGRTMTSNYLVGAFEGSLENTINNAGNDVTFEGQFIGPGMMNFVGSGETTLSNLNNQYLGATNIKQGTLKVTGSLSDETQVTVEKDATYAVESTDTIGSLAGAGSVTLASGKTLTAGSAVDTEGNPIDTTYSGVMSGDGGFTKAGASTTTFAGDNSYKGETTISAGTLEVTGSLSDTTTVNVSSVATYAVESTDTIGSLAGAGSVTLASGKTLTAGSAVDTEGNPIDTIYSGEMSGAGGFTKAGTSTTTFEGANSYSGATTISAGTLEVTGSLSDTTAVNVSSGATYAVESTDTIGSLAGAGSVTLASGKTLTAGIAEGDTIYSGVMSGAGGFTKAGTSTATFAGENSYSGATTISAGILEVTGSLSKTTAVEVSSGTLKVKGSLSDTTAVNVSSGATYAVDSTDTIGSLAGAGSVTLASGKTLTAGSAVDTQGNPIDTTYSGVMSGDGGFTKAGTSTATFAGENSYSGATTISAGTLEVIGLLSDTTAVNVSSGATYAVKNSDTIGSLAGAGSVTLASATMLTAGSAGDTTYSGVMSGAGGFTKAGTSTTTFAGENSYSGATWVNGGSLLASKDRAFSRQSLTTIAQGASIQLKATKQNINVLVLQASSTLTGDQAGTIDDSSRLAVSQLQNEGAIDLGLLAGTDQNDLFINAGALEVQTLPEEITNRKGQCGGRVDCRGSIDLEAGDDLIVTSPDLWIPDRSVIDGGDIGSLNNGQWQGEMNIFWSEETPQHFSRDQLKNFVLVRWGKDDDGNPDYQFPSGSGCVAPLTVTKDKTCVLLLGARGSNGQGNEVTIDAKENQATLRLGVGDLTTAVAPGTPRVGTSGPNIYRVKNGNLSAYGLIGGGAGSDDAIELGTTDGGQGHLSVGLLAGIETLQQNGGDWGYDIKYTTGGAASMRLNPIDLVVKGGSVTIDVNPDVKAAGNSERGQAWFKTINAKQARNLVQITNKGDLTVSEGIVGSAALTTAAGAETRLISAGSDYRGDTVIENGGLLTAEAENALSSKSTHTVKGVLDLDGHLQTVQKLQLEGGTVGAGTLWATDGIVSKGGEIFAAIADPDGQSDPGQLTVESGATTLWGENTYSGATNVEGGELLAGTDFTFSAKSPTTVSTGAVLNLNNTEQSIDDVILDEGKITSGSLQSVSGILSRAGVVESLSGSTGLIAESGVTTLQGQNLYQGDTVVRGGATLQASGVNALSPKSLTEVQSGAFLDLGAKLQTLGTLKIKSNGQVHKGSLVVNRLVNEGRIDVTTMSGTGESDVVLNSGSIAIGKGNWDLAGGDDLLTTNASITGEGIIDGGSGIDTIAFATRGSAQFSASKIQNFEFAQQLQGTWNYDGDYKAAGIQEVTVKGGVVLLSDDKPSIFDEFVLDGGSILAGLNNKSFAPLTADVFAYDSGSLIIAAGTQDEPAGQYTVIDAPGESQPAMNQLASSTQLAYDGEVAAFRGIGVNAGIPETESPVYDVYLSEGSLVLNVDLNKDLERPEEEGGLSGCNGNPLCEPVFGGGSSGSGGGNTAGNIFDEILVPGIIDESIKLPIVSWGTLAKLVVSGLSPRNVDGPGRGLATYSNLLSDTVFERLPLRQFTPVDVQEAVVEQEQVIESVPEQEPVRGLWNKSGAVSDGEAQQVLDQAIAQADGADVDQPLVLASEEVVFEFDGVSYAENPSLTAQYAERNGVRGWFRAFGGNSGASQSDVFYNDYSVNAGGGVVGVDVSVAPQVQIGAFANYGNINLWQDDSGTGGGSWNPDGWGGGITADYWTNNFYVQGLFAATGFAGSQRRGIVEITDKLGGESASGDKSATSYTYALRVGAPFETGRWLLEPQFTATWSQNQEHGFTESGAGPLNLRFQERSTLYLQTELGMKFTLPIRSGDRGLWVPSLKLAWLGDWNQNNGDQTIGYAFTNKTVGVPSNQEDVNGALVEVGLDYTIANLNSTSWKLYLKGGAELWGGDRGTDWRGSGGVTWQF